MPVKWDNEARYTLLLMVLSQAPSVLSSKVNADVISKSWPGPGDLTPRAVQEQVKLIRKEIQNIQSGKAPTTPPPSRRSTSTSVFSTPRKVSTPTSVSASVVPTKRTNGTAARPIASAAKKRRVTRKPKKGADINDSDTAEHPLTSEEDAPANETDEDDSPLSEIPTTIERRTLPARSKSRSQSYHVESDSEGGPGAKDGSEGDSEFSISKMQMDEEGRKKGRQALGTVLRGIAEKRVANGVGDGAGDVDDGDQGVRMERGGDGDGESDAGSGTTRRTSWKSALEEI